MMRAGQLRHRVKIIEVTEGVDAAGGLVPTTALATTVWAAIEPLKGRELLEAQQLRSQVTHRIRMREYDGLDSHHRLTFGDRTFNIEAVLDKDERGREMEVMCREET